MMNKMVVYQFAFLLAVISQSAGTLSASSDARDFLWPLPQQYSFTGNPVTVDSKSFQFIGEGVGGHSATLEAAFKRYMVYLFDQGASTKQGVINKLSVVVKSSSESLHQETNESYTLTITTTAATISAETIYGAMWGLETFSQMVMYDAEQYYLPLCSISDSPRFKYRGFLVDSSRHYQPLKYIYQFLDAMSFNKFNVLHWHIVDGESFPYVSTAYPELSAKGAYSPLHIYSPKDVQNVIAYAKERGIRVVPEFDTPGHSRAMGLSQPGLSTTCYDNSTHLPNGNYGPIDPTNESNWVFLEGLFKELSEVFSDQYLHLGGDEVSFACWSTNPNIWKWMADRNITGQYNQLEQYYATRLLALVSALDKSYIVWQEIFDNGLKVNPDTVIEVWKGNPDSRAAVTKAGLQAIYSACWYLNYIRYGPDWLAYYLCDPQDFDGTPEQKKLVIGGEACMWSEFVDGTNIISRSWPRGSAVGERLWSPQDVTNTTDAEIRLHNQRCRMVRRGYQAQPFNGPSFCPVEWEMSNRKKKP